MENIEAMLDKEYTNTLDALSQAVPGSQEADWQLKKLNDIHRHRMSEMESRQKSLDNHKDRIVKIVLCGVEVLVPIAVSSFWMAKGLIFEEKGAFVSRTAQWLNSHMRLFKK